jgi:hypothetical protein
MTKFKVGDKVKVVYIQNSYRGDYKQGAVGKIIEVSRSGRQLKLHGDNIKVNELWLEAEGVKLVDPNKYLNPPLPHCEERIAHARGANIEFEDICCRVNKWKFTNDPKWHENIKYRVKVEKTKDDLRIEELERLIFYWEQMINEHKKELAELKPTIHY